MNLAWLLLQKMTIMSRPEPFYKKSFLSGMWNYISLQSIYFMWKVMCSDSGGNKPKKLKYTQCNCQMFLNSWKPRRIHRDDIKKGMPHVIYHKTYMVYHRILAAQYPWLPSMCSIFHQQWWSLHMSELSS